MRRTVVVALIGVVAFASGVMLGFKLDSDDDTTPAATGGLPAVVEQTRAALLEAAESGNYESLRPLVGDDVRYTFGEPVEGGPIAFWQKLERTTDERPLESLSAVLRMPYVLSQGYYVWPFAYTAESQAELSPHERELLAPLGPLDRLVVDGTGYLGWRAGIAPDGTLGFFVSGD